MNYNSHISQVYLDATLLMMQEDPKIFIAMLCNVPMLSASHERSPTVPSWTLNLAYTNMRASSKLDVRRLKLGQVISRPPWVIDYARNDLRIEASVVDDIAFVVNYPVLYPYHLEWTSEESASVRVRREVSREVSRREVINFYLLSSTAYASTINTTEWTCRITETFGEVCLSLCQLAGSKDVSDATVGKHAPTLLTNLFVRLDAIMRSCVEQWQHALSLANFEELDLPLYKLRQLVATSFLEERPSFIVTRRGLCGFCMPGARADDTLSILFRDQPDFPEVRFVLQKAENGHYSMVSVAWFQDRCVDLARSRGLSSRRLWCLFEHGQLRGTLLALYELDTNHPREIQGLLF